MTIRLFRRTELLAVFALMLLMAVTVMQAAFYSHASANQIVSRRLTLQAGATDGGSNGASWTKCCVRSTVRASP